MSVGYWLMRKLGDFIFYVLRIRRKVALDNLRTALGKEKRELELLDIARRAYQNFAMTSLEVIHLPKFSLERIKQIAILDGKEYLDEGRRKGKGTVMVTGHLGCWDIMGFRILAEGYPMTYVSGGFRNQIIDNLYNRFREEKGIPVLPRKYALRGVIRSLKRNELLGVVSDQNAGDMGVFVDFFGKKASTPKGAALFALRTGAKMVVVLDVPLEGRKKHKAIVRPVNIEETGNEETDIYLYIQELTRIIEDIVREHPEHYFWLHRRWKTRPPD
jgi:KDO2-lipid IV(A) lauroyltransferase